MTLGFTSLGLVLVLLIIVPNLVFEKAFIYSVYLLICLCCNHKSLAFDMRVGHCILSILTVFCFHENRQLVVIISRFWDDLSPLFLWCQWWLNTIHVGETSHN